MKVNQLLSFKNKTMLKLRFNLLYFLLQVNIFWKRFYEILIILLRRKIDLTKYSCNELTNINLSFLRKLAYVISDKTKLGYFSLIYNDSNMQVH